MFDVKSQLGVQSWCFRNFKAVPALIEQVKGIGLSRVEVCAVHVDFNSEATFEGTIQQFKSAGVQITSIGVQTFRGDEATEEKWFRFCKMAGAKMISATFDVAAVPAAYRVAEKLAEKYDLVLGVHNHGGYDWLGNAMMLKQVFATTGERIGLCIDTAWCMQAGEEPVKWAAEIFAGRLYSAHVKDFVFHRDGRPEDVVVGTGNLKLKEMMGAVMKSSKLAAVTLEYEGDVENPGPALRECVGRVAGATTT
ncbi:MAG TPA: TIM barrel protein [Phycisphaerae bacterium]|nr:TIM barrel protein [Phycisphaerae bacterium]